MQRVAVARKELVEGGARAALEFEHEGFVADHRRPRPIYWCNAAETRKVPAVPKILHYYGCMSAEPDGAPPFLGTWKRVYIAVLIYLAAVISAFYLFTQAHR